MTKKVGWIDTANEDILGRASCVKMVVLLFRINDNGLEIGEWARGEEKRVRVAIRWS
jgi:hypothetical protein